MGLYFIGPGNYGPFLDAVAQYQPPVVVVANELRKTVAKIRETSPGTVVVARVTGHDAFADVSYAGGRAHVRSLLGELVGIPAHYFSIANERVPREDVDGVKRVCEAYIGAIDEGRANGLEVCALDLNTGFPNMARPGMREALADLLKHAKVAAVHFYARDGDVSAEPDASADPDALLWTQFLAGYPQLQVIVTEYGVLANDGTMPKGEAFERFLRRYDDLLAPLPQCLGAAVYALKGGSWAAWRQCDYTSELPRYGAYLAARRK
jgi:hypothetical protein